MEQFIVQLWTHWLFVVHAKHIGLRLISNVIYSNTPTNQKPTMTSMSACGRLMGGIFE